MSKNKFLNLAQKKDTTGQKPIEDTFNNIEGVEEVTKLISFDDIVPNQNPYPINDLEDMIHSIKMFGLEQNLVVKPIENGKYLIITGHRRYYAIKEILNSSDSIHYTELESLYCKVIDKDFDELSLRIRLHETNLTARSLLSMEENEKKAIVSEYMDLLQQARDNDLEINGTKVVGKTRDLIAKHFHISKSSAQRLMKSIKEDETDEGLNKSEKEVVELSPGIKQSQNIESKIKALGKAFENASDISQEELTRLIDLAKQLLNDVK